MAKEECPLVSQEIGGYRRLPRPASLVSIVSDKLSIVSDNPGHLVSMVSDKPGHVRLYSDEQDPSCRHLFVSSRDQVGLLFKLCELLANHGIDIRSANITTQNGIVSNSFELQTSGPANFDDALEWCKELEDFLAADTDSVSREGSLLAVSKRLSVNPDLLSVVAFVKIPSPEGSDPFEFRYQLELGGINQAGLLTYANLVFLRSGFTVVCANISTIDGQFSDTFELSTTSPDAEHLLRSYLDVPTLNRKYSAALPFQACASDIDLVTLYGNKDQSPVGSTVSVSDLDPSNTHRGARSPLGGLSPSPSLVPIGPDVLLEENGDTMQVLQTLDGFGSGISVSGASTPALPVRGRISSDHSARRNTNQSVFSDYTTISKEARRTSVSRNTVVHFQNGDVYSGSIVNRPDHTGSNECKRHGFGTYTYSNHASYKLYRGHWHEDTKHGYGVLFYRNGGAYAGQWENNSKHGMGVLLDNVGENVGQNDIPSFRYEGQWYQDLQHGLGVEESSESSFFGHFLQGGRQGRGVCMSASKSGMAAYDAIDGDERMPLLDCLEREVSRLCLESAASNHEYDLTNTNTVAAILSHRNEGASGDSGSGSSGPGSSGKMSCDTRTTLTPHPELLASPGGDNQSTPAMKPGTRGSVVMHQVSSRDRRHSGQAFVAQQRRTSSSSAPADDGIEFSLLEENNLLDDTSEIVGNERVAGADDSRQEFGLGLMGRSSDPGLVASSRARALRLSVSAPTDPNVPPIGTSVQDDVLGSSERSSPRERRNTQHRTLSPLRFQAAASRDPHPSVYATPRNSRNRKVLASPLLWSEDELAAFLTCLGIDGKASNMVQQRSLKGATQLLDMSNSEMRKQLNLCAPVERLVVRYSLRRLVEADRHDHHLRSQKATDLLKDSVLKDYIIPSDELRIIGKISQGGFGTVFRGMITPKQDRRNNLQANKQHMVAAKEMKGDKRVRLHELLKEANVMASLHHPNICSFLGICADGSGKKHYIVSELMDCSLFDLVHHQYKLRWHGDLTISVVIDVSLGICAGVTYLHMRSLVHADLKSSNILIDYSTSASQLLPRICDFGHAAVRPFPAPHHRMGTPHWAAPEALRSEALSPAADVYSFGVMLWEMLAQKVPHRSLYFAQVLAAVGWAGWTPDLSDLPEVPSELRRLLKACFSFSAADRPSAKIVGKRLKRIPRKANVKAFTMLSEFIFGLC